MSYTLIIRPEAETDLAEQFDWYEQRKQGLGYEFLALKFVRLLGRLKKPRCVMHRSTRAPAAR